MNKRKLLDTDVLIDFLRGNKHAISYFRTNYEFICFSAITVAEIFSGIRGKKEETEVQRLFAIFPIIETTKEIGQEAGKLVKTYRPSHSVEIPDAIIAATCLKSNLELVTLNIKHYPMFRNLQPPYVK